MSQVRPLSLFPQRAVRKCPVCGEATYSSGGIHPQCAVKHADEPLRLARVIEKKRAKAEQIAEKVRAEDSKR